MLKSVHKNIIQPVPSATEKDEENVERLKSYEFYSFRVIGISAEKVEF